MKRPLFILTLLLVIGSGSAVSAIAGPPGPVQWMEMKTDKIVPIQRSSIAGVGPTPVIIIADVGCDETAYAEFAKRHADRFTTHTLVLPGTSPGAKVPLLERGQVKDPFFLVNAMEAVQAYAKEHKIEKPVVIGHGTGGTVAYMLAAKSPDFASAFVVLDALPAMSVGEPGNIPLKEDRPSEVDKLERQSLLAMNQNAWMNRIRQNVPGQTTNKKRSDAIVNMMSAAPASAVRRYMLEALYLDMRDQLAASPAPLLLYGPIPDWMKNVDKQIVRAAFQNAVITRPASRLEILDSARHWVILDEPARFDDPLLKFLGLPEETAKAPSERKQETQVEAKPVSAKE